MWGYGKLLYFRMYFISLFCDLRLFRGNLKSARHCVFLLEFYICIHFTRTLNSRGFKFANISENKVLANNSESTIKEPPHDKTNKMTVCPAKTQISLGIHPVWSESLLCTQWVAKDPSFLHVDSEDSDQIGRMLRLIWVFAESTCHFAGFVMRRLKCFHQNEVW